MDNVSNLYERTRPDGKKDYVVNYGLVLYNNKIVNLSNLIIPIWGQSFFDLPGDKNRYALINAYYDVDNGFFIFDTVLKSDKFIATYSSDALSNLIPIAQFVLQQSLSEFVVSAYNSYSKMATYSATDTFDSGVQGIQGGMGLTGASGQTGIQGVTGILGYDGVTGNQGITGLGLKGYVGLEGETGYYSDKGLLYYAKFKSSDVTLQDYSPYERDFGWGASGAGVTGIVFIPGSTTVTGIKFVPTDLTSYTLADGVVDKSHNVVYRGGWSSYSRNRYLDFQGYTGMIQTWVRVDHEPLVNFSWVVDVFNPLRYTFTDESLFSPLSWEWTFNGMSVATVKNPTFIFSGPGLYSVKLKANNIIGSSERTIMVNVTV